MILFLLVDKVMPWQSLEYSEALWGMLLVLPIVWVIWWWARKQSRQTHQYVERSLWDKVHITKTTWEPWLRWSFFFAVVVLLLSVTLARPQGGAIVEDVEVSSADIVFVLDISDSMRALDFEQNGRQFSRLTLAKELIDGVMGNLPNDRFALVTFAGSAFSEVPLTLDHQLVREAVGGANPDQASQGGTNIAAALQQARDRFYELDTPQGRAVVLMSDGEQQQQSAIEVAQELDELDIQLITVGVGSTEGSFIPLRQSFFGEIEYKMYQNQRVVTALDEQLLQELSEVGDGSYYHLDELNHVAEISEDLADLDEELVLSGLGVRQEELFGRWGAVLLILLVVGWLLPPISFSVIGRSLFAWVQGKAPRAKLLAGLLLSSVLLAACELPGVDRRTNQQGNDAFARADLAAARSAYEEALELNEQSAYQYNLANVAYTEGLYGEAEAAYRSALSGLEDELGDLGSDIRYNLGNAQFRQAEAQQQTVEDRLLGANVNESLMESLSQARRFYEQALFNYEKVLEQDDGAYDADFNAEITRERLDQLDELERLLQEALQQQQDQPRQLPTDEENSESPESSDQQESEEEGEELDSQSGDEESESDSSEGEENGGEPNENGGDGENPAEGENSGEGDEWESAGNSTGDPSDKELLSEVRQLTESELQYLNQQVLEQLAQSALELGDAFDRQQGEQQDIFSLFGNPNDSSEEGGERRDW